MAFAADSFEPDIPELEDFEDDYERAEYLQSILIEHATGEIQVMIIIKH